MSDDDVSKLVQDTRIVRHETKIRSVAGNANLVCELADEYGGAGKAFAGWPSDDYRPLALWKKRERSAATMYFLRFSGVDSFIPSRDVVAALIREASSQGAERPEGPGGYAEASTPGWPRAAAR